MIGNLYIMNYILLVEKTIHNIVNIVLRKLQRINTFLKFSYRIMIFDKMINNFFIGRYSLAKLLLLYPILNEIFFFKFFLLLHIQFSK